VRISRPRFANQALRGLLAGDYRDVLSLDFAVVQVVDEPVLGVLEDIRGD